MKSITCQYYVLQQFEVSYLPWQFMSKEHKEKEKNYFEKNIFFIESIQEIHHQQLQEEKTNFYLCSLQISIINLLIYSFIFYREQNPLN